jgi:5-methylcytosine-specific restriction enzyme subunit McrC
MAKILRKRASPEPGSVLSGLRLEGGLPDAEALTASGKLGVLELAKGVEIRASSWVGRVELGKLTVTVQPKIPGAPFLHLLRYAYGLRQLTVHDTAWYGAEHGTFQDLIVRQFASEVEELVARGLHRDYRREPAELAAPRGRIDFQRYVMAAGAGRASLPCVHYPRTRATILNRVLLSGLVLAARVIDDVEMRAHLRRIGRALDIDEPPLRLDREALEKAWSSTDRRTRAYEPALTLIGLLMQAEGISLDEDVGSLRLSGFLFDMNRFFQALLSRFLRENLVGYAVRDEHRLQGMFAFHPSGNPRARRAPTPRPDFVILAGNRIASVLDAKYRDLWEHSLPRDMLYQLALYALGHSGYERQAVILYPTLDASATDQTIILKEPVSGLEQARVMLRPVKLLELEELLSASISVERERRCAELAKRFAFGGQYKDKLIETRMAISA